MKEMAERVIQEQFGEAILAVVRDFARSDLDTVSEMEKKYFSHITDGGLQRALALPFSSRMKSRLRM